MKSFFYKLFSFNTLQRLRIYVAPTVAIMCVLLLISSFSVVSAETRYRVKASDSLNRIVLREYPNSSLSKQQLMIAIFIRNPKAFRKGDINFLMRGKRLVLPSEENLEIVSHEDAISILKRGTKSFQREILGEAEPITDFELSDLSQRELEILSGEQPTEVEIAEQPEKQADENATGQTSELVAPQTVSQQKSPDKTRKKNNNREKKALIKSRKELSLAQKKLKKMEDERQRLKAQLEKLTNEKKQADHKLLTLEEKLKQNNEQVQIQKAIQVANVEINKQEAKTKKETQQDTKTLPEDVIAEDKKKREFEEKVKQRTESLKEANMALQQKLQQTRSELAENTRENISMSRKLNTLKESPATQVDEGEKPAMVNNSVATEIGSATHSEKTLDEAVKTVPGRASDSSLGKMLWLLPVLAFFAGLWFLLRRFLNTGKNDDTLVSDGDVYATPAFESDDIDADYEEASLETSIKLDVARAYLEADDRESAFEMLQEVIDEGDEEQQQEARDIMASHS